jgi:hypothetical protein
MVLANVFWSGSSRGHQPTITNPLTGYRSQSQCQNSVLCWSCWSQVGRLVTDWALAAALRRRFPPLVCRSLQLFANASTNAQLIKIAVAPTSTASNLLHIMSITIGIKKTTEESFSVTLPSPDTALVDDLRAQVAAAAGFPPQETKLIFQGKFLKDGSSLASYSIVDGVVVHLMKQAAAPAAGAASAPEPSALLTSEPNLDDLDDETIRSRRSRYNLQRDISSMARFTAQGIVHAYAPVQLAPRRSREEANTTPRVARGYYSRDTTVVQLSMVVFGHEDCVALGAHMRSGECRVKRLSLVSLVFVLVLLNSFIIYYGLGFLSHPPPSADSMAQISCNIGGRGASAIAEAIQVNTTVEQLDLVSNRMQS